MKNFLSTARLKFTALFCIMALMLFAPPPGAFAQTNLKPFNLPTESFSQMWSISNTYTSGANVYHNTVTADNLGSQIDTVKTGAMIPLYIANFGTGFVNVDTFTPRPLYGTGTMTFAVSCQATNTITTVALNLRQSINGVDWVPVASQSTQSITSTSKTVQVPGTSTATFTLAVKQGLYYRVESTAVTDDAAIRGYWYLQRPYTLMKSTP